MKPNVLLVVLDTLRASNCSSYGYERDTAPGLESLKPESIQFDHAVAPETWTVPSHAAMFTGDYPSELGIHARNKVLPSSEQTVASRLQPDYSTAIMSSNPFLTEGSELYRGCDYRHTSGMKRTMFDDAFDPAKYIKTRRHEHGPRKFLELAGELWAPPIQAAKNASNALYYKYRTRLKSNKSSKRYDPADDDGAKETISEFINWTERQKSPFYACLNFMEAHTPLRYRTRYTPDWVTEDDLREISQDRDAYFTGKEEFTDRPRELLEALYDAEIRYLDDQLQRLWNHLCSTEQWENTLVIITSDHGEYLGENDLMFHGINRLDEQLVHVPLQVKYPDGEFAGKTVTETVSLTQIQDTILEVAGKTSDTRNPLKPGESPDLVKSEFVCMDPSQGIEQYLEEYQDLDIPSRAVYHDNSKYLLFEDGRAYFTENYDDEAKLRNREFLSLDDIPERIREFANLDADIEGRGDIDVSQSVESRLEDLGYR